MAPQQTTANSHANPQPMGDQSRSPIAIQRQVTIAEFATPGDRAVAIFFISPI